MDVLASRGDERRGSLRYVSGSRQTGDDPGISECGNAAGLNTPSPHGECIAVEERTQGTETSKYLEEKRKKLIPSVAASERGGAQTRIRPGVAGALS